MASEKVAFLVWEDDNGEKHAINVDLVKTHEDERTATVTSHPVERGAAISDHVIHDPDKLTLEIAQTQTPLPSPAFENAVWDEPVGFSTKTVTLDVRKSLFKPGGLLAVTRGIEGVISSGLSALGLGSEEESAKVTVFQSDEPVDRIGELHDQLISIKEKSRFCTVTFRGRVYPNYIVTKVGWSSAPGEAGIGRFKLELQSVRLVTNATAELPDPASLRLFLPKYWTSPPKPVAKGSGAEDARFNDKRESIASKLLGGAGRPSS
jgi:hypothetical protein